jgi:hypothetical protein
MQQRLQHAFDDASPTQRDRTARAEDYQPHAEPARSLTILRAFPVHDHSVTAVKEIVPTIIRAYQNPYPLTKGWQRRTILLLHKTSCPVRLEGKAVLSWGFQTAQFQQNCSLAARGAFGKSQQNRDTQLGCFDHLAGLVLQRPS